MVRARKPNPDGRAGNGGARQGTPGQGYSNRSDMRAQKVSVPPSAQYGQGEALRRSQQAVPMAGAPAVPSAPAGAPAPAPRPWATPEDTPTLTAPTNRPDEPVEAGMAFGPGAGPSTAPGPMGDDEARLRAMYAVHPNPELRELIQQLEQG